MAVTSEQLGEAAMSRERFPIVDARWAGHLNVLVLRTDDNKVWSLNPETKNPTPILLSSEATCDELLASSEEAVLISSGWAKGWSFVRITLDDDGQCIPSSPTTPIVADTSSWRNPVWLMFPFLLVQVRTRDGDFNFQRVNVVSGAMEALTCSNGLPATCNRGDFLLDQDRRSVGICRGFEVPIFDLDSIKQTGVIEPRIAVYFSNKAVYRSKDTSILNASYQGLYKSQVGSNVATWSIEHPTLFNCTLLGYSQALQSYILLNNQRDRIGVVKLHLSPASWWKTESGGIEVPSDHSEIHLNGHGDQVLLVRGNKSIDVRSLGALDASD